jgi:hypothetical protein
MQGPAPMPPIALAPSSASIKPVKGERVPMAVRHDDGSELAIPPQNFTALRANAKAHRRQFRSAAKQIAHARCAIGMIAIARRGGLARQQILEIECAGGCDGGSKKKNGKQAFQH